MGGVEDLCHGLQDYIDKANHTAWENEKPELDQHLQEVDDLEDRIDSHPCPCVWGEWGEWAVCSTTCEAGSTERHRVIEKEAINNGTECEGDSAENEVCNEDVCCLSTANGVYGQIGQTVHLDRIKQRLGHGKRLQQNAKDLIAKAKIMREFLVQGK